MLPRPNTKHPTELWWSPKAKQGLQLPRLMTSAHLLCATPLKHIKYFKADRACAVGTGTRETPSPSPPSPKAFPMFAFAISKGGHSPIPEALSCSLVVPK